MFGSITYQNTRRPKVHIQVNGVPVTSLEVEKLHPMGEIKSGKAGGRKGSDFSLSCFWPLSHCTFPPEWCFHLLTSLRGWGKELPLKQEDDRRIFKSPSSPSTSPALTSSSFSSSEWAVELPMHTFVSAGLFGSSSPIRSCPAPVVAAVPKW